MANDFCFLVSQETAGTRVDKLLADSMDGFTRSGIQHLLSEGNVTCGAKPITKNYKCREGDEIRVFVPDAKPLDVEAQDIPLDIVYEDEYLLVVNKPKGMVVHPANGNYDGTLVNALMHHCGDSLSGINGVIRPGIVHRIDKDTSGLLIVAKTDAAHIGLAEQIKEHSFTRAYEAVVYGNIKDDEGTICQPIGRNPKDRKKMAVVYTNSKPATTHYKVLQRFGNFTHIRCVLETGRTHQIRVHMAFIGHPIAGDSVYGPKKVITELNGQCLHAKQIGFVHPITKEYMEFESDLPEYFTKFLTKLKHTTNL
ncbi:MAG: RluA family pseudouridine synthase [Oscillospiraceae bacterium]|nr:RluA family pseudouridine synthase [Oscillospiraceae bacterium]